MNTINSTVVRQANRLHSAPQHYVSLPLELLDLNDEDFEVFMNDFETYVVGSFETISNDMINRKTKLQLITVS